MILVRDCKREVGPLIEHGSQRRVRAAGKGLLRAAGPGAAVIYLSLLVLIPIAALATQAFHGGWTRSGLR